MVWCVVRCGVWCGVWCYGLRVRVRVKGQGLGLVGTDFCFFIVDSPERSNIMKTRAIPLSSAEFTYCTEYAVPSVD